MTVNRLSARYRTAVHEAGHFVVGMRLGLAVGSAAIERTKDRHGWCRIDPPWWGDPPGPGRRTSWARKYIVAVMAGAEAEIALLGQCDGGDWGDRKVVWEAMKHIRMKGCSHVGDAIWSQTEKRLRRESRRLCILYGDEILAVADELDRHSRVRYRAA